MLSRLVVRNLALISELELEFEPGFTVLTGETGAGKSMLIDALGLVLGGRARPELIRAGAKEAEVEALFELEVGSATVKKLRDAGVVETDERSPVELVLRRTLQEGKSRAYVNGRLSTAHELALLQTDLCDVASQHESVTLTEPATHLGYLDAFGTLTEQRNELGSLVDSLTETVAAIEEARRAESARAEREEFLEFQRREIDELGAKEGEETDLENERARLRHANKISGATRLTADRLYEGEGAICDELGRLINEIDGAAALDASLTRFVRSLEGARAELADVARALARYADAIESNPGRLAEVEERLFRLEKILRRHGPTTRELLSYREQLEGELDRLRTAHVRIDQLAKEREALLDRVTKLAHDLSRKRRTHAERLADAVGKQLALLGMGRARVLVDVSSAAGVSGGLEIAGARLTKTGLDRVEFLIAPNPGEDPRPLRRIASGGELSRSLLALKRVLAENGPAGLYVFDEVDAGVGGAIAEVIGRAILDVARHRQVLCITHLPQIASLADTHLVVEKREAKGRTTTSVRRLSAADRVEEIARMVGGIKVGDASRRAARELLSARSSERG